jgi:hypothetical protein
LVEFRPIWLKFNPWLIFCAKICLKFSQFGKFSANFDGVSSVKNGDRIKTVRIRSFLEEFRPLLWKKITVKRSFFPKMVLDVNVPEE